MYIMFAVERRKKLRIGLWRCENAGLGRRFEVWKALLRITRNVGYDRSPLISGTAETLEFATGLHLSNHTAS
jgi:hypothetical protein